MLTSEKVKALHNKVSVDGAKLLQHTENGTVFAIDDIADEVVELERENKEWEQSFDSYCEALMWGTKKWQDDPENDTHILPDTGKMIAWMVDQIDKLKAEKADLKDRLRAALMKPQWDRKQK